MVTYLIWLLCFGLRFNRSPNGCFILGSSFGINFCLFWKIYSISFGFQMALIRILLSELAASPLHFSFISHIEDLGVQVIVFKWAPRERVVKFLQSFQLSTYVSSQNVFIPFVTFLFDIVCLCFLLLVVKVFALICIPL